MKRIIVLKHAIVLLTAMFMVLSTVGVTGSEQAALKVTALNGPTCEITNPHDGDTVSGTVQITVDVTGGEPPILMVGFNIQGNGYSDSYIDDDGEPWEYSWETLQVNNGQFTIEAFTMDGDGTFANDIITVNVNNDQLDQMMEDSHFSLLIEDSILAAAQSFKPTLPTLTRVEIYGAGSYRCSIREDLDGSDLRTVTESYGDDEQDWLLFDFQDLTVTPESTYYIVLEPIGSDTHSWCGYYQADIYQRGQGYYNRDGQGWTIPEEPYTDLMFRTYGMTEDCDGFMGLCVEPLGDAVLDIGDELHVYNLDDAGDDGVMIDLEGYNTYTCTLENPFETDAEATLNFELTGNNGKDPFWMELQVKSNKTKSDVRRGEHALGNAYSIIGFGPDDDIVYDEELDEEADLGFVVDDSSNNNFQFSGIYCASCPLRWIGQGIMWQHPVLWTWEGHDVNEMPIKKLIVRGIVENVDADSYISDSSISSIGIDGFTILEHYAYALDPPAGPSINGQTKGNSGKSYDYEISNIGVSDVYFLIEWDDGSEIEYTDLTSPGVTKTVSHIWTVDGTYNVKARAMSEEGMMSEWETLEVSMPKNKATNRPILNFLEKHPNMFPILRLLLKLVI